MKQSAAQQVVPERVGHDHPLLVDPVSLGFPDDPVLDIPGPSPEEEPLTLALTDLIQDANGEIVLFNDSHLRSLALATDAQPVSEGEARQHVTATGEDVSGFRYVTFDNGLTLYYQPQLELHLRPEHG